MAIFSTFGAYKFLTNQKLKKALGGAKDRLFLCRLAYAGDFESVSSRWHFVPRETTYYKYSRDSERLTPTALEKSVNLSETR